jgi:hypothetical protein
LPCCEVLLYPIVACDSYLFIAHTGGPGFVAHVVMRVIYTDFYTKGDIYTITRTVFGVMFIYVFFASKIYVLMYIFQCMVMKNTFKKWSERLDHVVNRGESTFTKMLTFSRVNICYHNATLLL